jgi:hypothetical protein
VLCLVYTNLQSTVAYALGFSRSTSRLLATDLDAQNSLTLQALHINLLFTEAVFSTYADNSLRTRTLLLYYSYFTRAALPSVSPINAGILHAEKAALCTVERDVIEITWSFLIVARPNTYRVT